MRDIDHPSNGIIFIVFRLPNLRFIDLTDTRVTGEGLSLFLACHANIHKIEHKETFHAFKLIQAQCSTDTRYYLRNLSTIDDHLTPNEFDYVIDRCPYLESVKITSAGLCNENLYKLMTLSNLTNLHLGNKNCQSFNFYEGVAPVLDQVGSNLKVGFSLESK